MSESPVPPTPPDAPPDSPPDLGHIALFSGLKPHEKKVLEAGFAPPRRPPGSPTPNPGVAADPPPRARYSLWRKGEVFVKQGEFTGHFHVVLSGIVSAFRTESSGETRALESLGPGRWFGEVSALSNQPALATLKAETPCLTLSLAPELFKTLYAWSADFRKRVDDNYRERGLLIHLRTVPLFRGLPEAELRTLRGEVTFRTFEADAVIAREDTEAEAVYLVRSGAVKCVRAQADGGERILGYFMNNASFGEGCLAEQEAKRMWRGRYVAMTRTDVLEVPRDVLHRFPQEALGRLRSTAQVLLDEEEGRDTRASTTTSSPATASSAPRPMDATAALEVEQMVHKGSAKGGEALVIDIERCVRCNACVESCVAVHEDRVPRLSKKGSRLTFEGEEATHHRFNLATSCYNCQVPGCMLACNFGAIRRDVLGLVRFDYDNCIGCAACVEACPYDVIRTPAAPTPEDAPKAGFWWRFPVLGKLLAKPAAEPAPSTPPPAPDLGTNQYGVPLQGPQVVKCDLCAGLPFQACVYNCPCSAILRVDVQELLRRKEVRSQGTFSFTRH